MQNQQVLGIRVSKNYSVILIFWNFRMFLNLLCHPFPVLVRAFMTSLRKSKKNLKTTNSFFKKWNPEVVTLPNAYLAIKNQQTIYFELLSNIGFKIGILVKNRNYG